MDTNALIREARARFQHQESKQYLKEKYLGKLRFTAQGGLWTASVELISFLRTTTQETIVLLDEYQKPIKVKSRPLLLEAEQIYTDVMSEWYDEYENLKSRR